MLNRLSCTLSLLLIVAVGIPGVLTAAPASVSREITLSPADLSVRSVQGIDFVDLRGGAHAMRQGEPDLPLLSVHLRLPEGSATAQVRVVPLDYTVLPRRYHLAGVAPAQPGEWTAQGQIDPAILAASSWYPSAPLVSHRDGRMRGHPVAGVAVAPLSWNPATGELRLMTRFRVEVITQSREPRPGDLKILRESREGSRTFEEALTALTGTPNGVLGAAGAFHPLVNSGAPFAPTFRPSLDGSPVDMVIITTADQAAEYQRLADYKNKIGISTVVRTLDWIQDNYPNGVDTEETIRNFIRDAVAKWGTAWVLLGGDTGVIPIRYGYTTFYGSEDIPTDLYYTDLDGNWNGDGDSKFGEGWASEDDPADDADLSPDVRGDRMTSHAASEAQVLVDKTLLYLQNPPIGYETDFLFLGEVLFPPNWNEGNAVQFDGAVLCEDVVDSMEAHQNAVRLYENYTAWPGSLPETKSAVVDSINAGFNLVHHVGHGYINTMSVGINQATLINADADALHNADEFFFLYAINCTSAAIDFNCIAERFLSNPNGGAVGVEGSTRLDFPSTGRYYQNEFFGLIFTHKDRLLGRTTALSKVPFVPFATQDNPHRWTQFAEIYLGDPSLPFWTDVPGSLSVSHPATFELGQTTFAVTVSFNSAPVESAQVALFKDGDAYAVGLTDASGQAVLPFAPDETGSFSVGVFRENFLPYLGTATVTAPSAPHLYASSQTVDDDGLGGSTGNGDGKLDAGETVELKFTLGNSGGTTETGTYAVLHVSSPYFTVSDSVSSFPDIAPAGSGLAVDPMIFTISRSAPDRLEAKATLEISGDHGTYTEEVILYVQAPIFQYYLQAVRDTIGNGDGNGVLAENEDFAIVPRIRNLGLGSATAVEARLRSTDPAVTITDSVSVIGTIASGQVGVNLTDGFAASLSDTGSVHTFQVVLVDAYGEVFSISVDVLAPSAPANVVTYGASNSISLTWNPVPDADLWGYAVYRAASETGPFTRINETTTDGTAYYRDEGLPPLTRYYYAVAAVDSSGNEGPLSVVASGTTSLPIHDGFPVEVTTSTTGGITIADLDQDGELEILGAGEEIYAVRHDGSDYYDADSDVRTLGPITNTGGQLFWNTPAVGDVDLDGLPEIAGVSWTDPKVWLVDDHGVPLPGWPKPANPLGEGEPNPLGSVCLADVDADGDLEILCNLGRAILAWHPDGSEVADGDNNPSTDGVLLATSSPFSYGTPTVANIDDDPYPEILSGMADGGIYVLRHDGTVYPGFPFMTGGSITGSIAVGDIDLDGQPEIVIGSSDNLVYAIRADGTSASGFPVGIQLTEDTDCSPSLGDINGDGYPDVAIGASNGAFFVFSGHDGSVLPGFPVPILDNLGQKVPVRSSPALVDIDGNGSLDILFGDMDGRLHCYDASGQSLPGFPIQTGNLIESAPAAWDVDGDGLTEVMAESYDQKIYCWDTPWTFHENTAIWPMFKRNQRNTGVYNETIFQRTGVPDETAALRPVLMQNYPNPFLASTTIPYRVPAGKEYQGVRLSVYDLSGRMVRTLVYGEQPPGRYDLIWDGRDDQGRRMPPGIYPYRLEVAGKTVVRKMVLLR